MTTNKNSAEPELVSPQRRLISWPFGLIALTLTLLLVAGTVSAWGRGDRHDGDAMREHVHHVLDRMLDRIDATDEQTAAIEAIVERTVADLQPERGDRGEALAGTRDGHSADPDADDRRDRRAAHREAIHALLTAETIDRDAIEAMRSEHLERADEVTRLVSERLADALEVLTPEQRAELGEQLSKRRHRFFRHGRD